MIKCLLQLCFNIVILPLASAANDQESDTENVPEQFVDENRLFEPAGELEVDYSSSEESKEDISVLEPSKNVKNYMEKKY